MAVKPRIFIHNGTELPDPDPNLNPNQVRDLYAAQYPELTTANAVFSKDGGKDIYTFAKSVGTKG